jgi:hypothetical protein
MQWLADSLPMKGILGDCDLTQSQLPESRIMRKWLVAAFSFLGIAKRLLRFYREEFEVRKTVPAVKSMAKKIQIEFTT